MWCKGMSKSTKHIGIEFGTTSVKRSQKTSKFDHTANSVMNSQSLIQLCINKFVGCLASIENSNPSGVNEQEKITKAKELYKKVHKTSFQLDHCWNILRHQPKWLEFHSKPQMNRRSSATSCPYTPKLIHLREDEASHASFVDWERPPSQKAKRE